MADFVHFSAEIALTALMNPPYAHSNIKTFCLPGTTDEEYPDEAIP
jgi:hypothetical protein